LLQLKVDLLKTALSKKATLLDIHEEDLRATVDILHSISLRHTLHIIKMAAPEKNYEAAIKLFGINRIYGGDNAGPLLAQLDKIGTLFIENIHWLNLETQEYLAHLITYGYFKTFKGEQKSTCDVRIICSSNRDLQAAVQESTFSVKLFDELKKTSLSMPSLLTLPVHELNNLASGFTDQAIQNQELKHMLELSDKEKDRVNQQRPASLHEFKGYIKHVLVEKSTKQNIAHEITFDPAYTLSDPDLAKAARLGKRVLKDPQMMTLLWNKFKSQTQIADLLGVNRSSVHRRCKMYGLITHESDQSGKHTERHTDDGEIALR
jgi:two-component system, NtrC family, nitrogen regulation response regulator NtrX